MASRKSEEITKSYGGVPKQGKKNQVKGEKSKNSQAKKVKETLLHIIRTHGLDSELIKSVLGETVFKDNEKETDLISNFVLPSDEEEELDTEILDQEKEEEQEKISPDQDSNVLVRGDRLDSSYIKDLAAEVGCEKIGSAEKNPAEKNSRSALKGRKLQFAEEEEEKTKSPSHSNKRKSVKRKIEENGDSSAKRQKKKEDTESSKSSVIQSSTAVEKIFTGSKDGKIGSNQRGGFMARGNYYVSLQAYEEAKEKGELPEEEPEKLSFVPEENTAKFPLNRVEIYLSNSIWITCANLCGRDKISGLSNETPSIWFYKKYSQSARPIQISIPLSYYWQLKETMNLIYSRNQGLIDSYKKFSNFRKIRTESDN